MRDSEKNLTSLKILSLFFLLLSLDFFSKKIENKKYMLCAKPLFSWPKSRKNPHTSLEVWGWAANLILKTFSYFCSLAQSCPTLCNPMHCSTPGFPILCYLPAFAQTHVHWVNDAIHPSHPLSPPSVYLIFNRINLATVCPFIDLWKTCAPFEFKLSVSETIFLVSSLLPKFSIHKAVSW